MAFKRSPVYLLRRISTCIDKTFSLPVGDNGSISLRVTRPRRSKVTAGSKPKLAPNVILYLPPGPLFQDSTSIKSHGESTLDVLSDSLNINDSKIELPVQHLLASTTSATVVTVNYRLGRAREITSDTNNSEALSNSADKDGEIDPQEKFYQYPNPVHDTLFGFDWIQTHLKPTQLGILGSNIGGSLALMLALTEAQSIQAVAAFDPVCDWTSLDQYCTIQESTDQEGRLGTKHKRSTRKIAPADLVPLLEAREKFFASPEKWFDSFASPILFLRSAGREIPKFSPQYLTGPEYPVPVLKNAGNQTISETIDALSGYDISEFDDDQIDTERVVKRRKAISRWPPYGLDYGLSGQTWKGPDSGIDHLQISLPWVRVFTQGKDIISNLDTEQSRHSAHTRHSNHNTPVLAQQGKEMISAMQRACFWGREKGYGERRVTLSPRDNNSDQEVGTWFKSIFDNTIDDD